MKWGQKDKYDDGPGCEGSRMLVRIKALRPFKEALGSGELELELPEGLSVEGLVMHLAREHPAFASQALDDEGIVDLTLNIMVSGKPVGEHDLAKPLQDGDEVLLFMPLSGG
jgi:molybdopterin synthase sulfur carrier subunit